MSKYTYPKEIAVTEGTANALDDLYEHIKKSNDLYDYFKTAQLMTEDRMIDLIVQYGQITCNLMCWMIQNDKFDLIEKVKKSNDKKQY